MRKIIVEAEVSLDGISDSPDFMAQVFNYHSPDVQAYLSELLFLPDALLMGRATYEFFAEYWVTREGKDADRINSLPKYVASRTLKEPLNWNATLIGEDVAGEIESLKQQPGGYLLQYGIGELTRTMLAHDLVDELRLVVYPFTVGNGPHHFENMGLNLFKLLDVKTFSSGAIALHYQSAGK